MCEDGIVVCLDLFSVSKELKIDIVGKADFRRPTTPTKDIQQPRGNIKIIIYNYNNKIYSTG